MNLAESIRRIVHRLDEAGLHYALIGGMAMALRGVHRATFDLDFILLLEDLPAAHALLESEGFARTFQSENVSHYEKADAVLNRIDMLHAFRPPSLRMFERSSRLPLGIEGDSVPVLAMEDLIGLKLQALKNDPRRALLDWNDIFRLVQHCAASKQAIDWTLIDQYLETFELTEKAETLRQLFDETH